MTILLTAALFIYLYDAIRSREPFRLIVAVVGVVLWVLHCLKVFPIPPCLG